MSCLVFLRDVNSCLWKFTTSLHLTELARWLLYEYFRDICTLKCVTIFYET